MSLIYRNKFALPSLPPPDSFRGKSILITGGTSGLGLAAAVHYINLGAASVTITARTEFKGLAAVREIERLTGKKETARFMLLDMSTFATTMSFVRLVKEEGKEYDTILLNAGIVNRAFKLGPETFEETLQIHVLSTALLGLQLLAWMKSLPVTVVGRHLGFVTSGLHRGVKIAAGDGWPQGDVLRFWSTEENWRGSEMYAISKLLEQYVVNEIAGLS
ncbi:Short-chain dehydrogenase/reductase tropG, partial [Lachnellula suecica]